MRGDSEKNRAYQWKGENGHRNRIYRNHIIG